MYAVSDYFLGSVRSPGRRKTVADLYYATSLAPIITDLPVVGGTMTIDRGSDIRRSGSLQIATNTLNFNQFNPTGIEVVVRSGFNYSTGTTELVPLGRFRVEDMSFDDGAYTTLSMNFYDRGRALQDIQDIFDRDLAGKIFQDVLQDMVQYTFTNTGMVVALNIDAALDPGQRFPAGNAKMGTFLDTGKKIAEAMRAEQYFDGDGNWKFAPVPSISTDTPTTAAVWEIDVGEMGVLISAGRKTTRANTYNGVAVYGAAVEADNSNRVFGRMFDSNSASPTFYDGKFGRKTLVIENDTLITSSDCFAVAEAQLKNLLGLAKSVSFTSLWNPALDAGDIVQFTFLDQSTEIHLIDSLSFDFASGEMTGETRTVQYLN